jgi:hypothetical protein
MAVPSNPTVTDIVTDGLKHGGRVNPTSTDITNATSSQFQQVKADIYLKAPRHSALLTHSIIPTTPGISRYTWPTACEAIRSVQLIDASTDGAWRGTAQSGGANYITLASTFNEENDTLIGRFVFITGGTGTGQFAQCTAYNNTTKVLTIEANWSALNGAWVTPDVTSSYLVETWRRKLWDYSKPVDWDSIPAPFVRGTPTTATVVGHQLWLDYTPDRVYVLLLEYWQALDRLDEDSTLFRDHLRKFRSLWTQGVAVKVMQRYDEDRYPTEIGVYNTMLDLYGSETSAVGQVTFRDIT